MMTLVNKISTVSPIFSKIIPKLCSIQTVNGTHTRQIHWKRLSNKRITRLETDIELDDCEEYKSRLINRNPRNLEQLCFEKKPAGFFMEKAPPTTWNILSMENDGNYLKATLRHWSGRKILEASTKEEQLAKYFTSPTSTQAAVTLAQVISRRCLQSGYLYAGISDNGEENLSLKEKAFYDAVRENGFTLNEPQEITPRSVTDI